MPSINWQSFKCRCSAINQMLSESKEAASLTEKQIERLKELEGKEVRTDKMNQELADLLLKKENSKKIILSDSCIGYLMEHYAWVTQKMVSVTKEMDIDAIRKGRLMEEEGLVLISAVDGVEYTQYDGERISNEYLTGMPDVFLGESVYEATVIIDQKNTWDYPGFLKKINTPVSVSNKQQVQGYMAITGAKEGYIVDCLVNMPEQIINDYRRRLFYRMNVISEDSPEYQEAVREMERSMYFDIIPKHQRVFKKKVEPFSDFEKQKIADKVKICADWLYQFDEMYQKLNK